ncbi:GNAT family N-acetyltransferase [Halomonas sp. LS-001]
MTICHTQRLLIRTLSLNDVPELTGMLSDPDVMQFSVHGVCDEAATRRFIERCMACYADDGFGPWALVEKDTDQLVGFCGISAEKVNGVEEMSLGYRLARRYWRKGLASEAVKAVLGVALSQALTPSVVVIIEPENMASLKVAEAAGFREFEVLEFHDRQVRVYRLTLQQWALHNNAATLAGI